MSICIKFFFKNAQNLKLGKQNIFWTTSLDTVSRNSKNRDLGLKLSKLLHFSSKLLELQSLNDQELLEIRSIKIVKFMSLKFIEITR